VTALWTAGKVMLGMLLWTLLSVQFQFLKITPAFWHCTSSFAFDSTGCTVAIAWADVLKYSTACTLCISLPCAQQQLSN